MLEDGDLLEKAAANVSIVRGTLSPARAQAMSSRGRGSIDAAGGQPYSAAALSLVFHAAHPMVPTLRADVRLFQVRTIKCFEGMAWQTESGQPLSRVMGRMCACPACVHAAAVSSHFVDNTCFVAQLQVDGQAWFGGGCDLTPSYLFEEDAVQFHQHWKEVCDRYDTSVYPEFKAWCDRQVS